MAQLAAGAGRLTLVSAVPPAAGPREPILRARPRPQADGSDAAPLRRPQHGVDPAAGARQRGRGHGDDGARCAHGAAGADRRGPARRGGSLDKAERFEQLVDPGVPIPPMASAIHGIKDEHVGNAPSFSAIAPELEAFIGSSVADRPYHRLRSRRAAARIRAGRPEPGAGRGRSTCATLPSWRSRRSPATTSSGCANGSPSTSPAGTRRSAMRSPPPGCSRPWCRCCASAASARSPRRRPPRARCRSGGHRRSRGSAVEEEPPQGDTRRPIARVDSFVYRHRVRDVMSAPAVTAPADATVGDTIRLLIEQEDQLGVRHRRQRRLRHRHRARSPARARHGRAEGPRGAARQHRQEAAAIGAGGRLPLSRHRPHGAAGLPPPRRAQCPRQAHRRRHHAQPAAASGHDGDRAGRSRSTAPPTWRRWRRPGRSCRCWRAACWPTRSIRARSPPSSARRSAF